MYWKVNISKVCYVKARDEDEAREMAQNDDFIIMDEIVEHVEPSCRADVQQALDEW